MWTDDGLMVLRPEDQVARNGIVHLMAASESSGGWGAVLVSSRTVTTGRTHIHRGESEAFWIVEGELELYGSSSMTPLVAGTFVHIPPDIEHGLLVKSTEASWLAIWPAALDGLLDELAEAHQSGGAAPDALDEIRSRHGVDIGRAIPHVT